MNRVTSSSAMSSEYQYQYSDSDTESPARSPTRLSVTTKNTDNDALADPTTTIFTKNCILPAPHTVESLLVHDADSLSRDFLVAVAPTLKKLAVVSGEYLDCDGIVFQELQHLSIRPPVYMKGYDCYHLDDCAPSVKTVTLLENSTDEFEVDVVICSKTVKCLVILSQYHNVNTEACENLEMVRMDPFGVAHLFIADNANELAFEFCFSSGGMHRSRMDRSRIIFHHLLEVKGFGVSRVRIACRSHEHQDDVEEMIAECRVLWDTKEFHFWDQDCYRGEGLPEFIETFLLV